MGVPWIYAKWLRLFLKVKSGRLRSVVLTFDDGPGNRLTPIILRILNEHSAKATFFLLGRNIEGNESMLRQIVAEGHEICSHGYDHLHYWKVSPLRALDDIKRGWQAIDKALGWEKGTYAFRPAYGKLNLVCLMYLLVRKIPIIYWTVDLGDTASTKNKRSSQRAVLLARKAGGAVVLAHDFDRSDDNSATFVVEALQLALSMAKENNMQVMTVSEFLSHCG